MIDRRCNDLTAIAAQGKGVDMFLLYFLFLKDTKFK